MSNKVYNNWNSIEERTLSPLEREYVSSLIDGKVFSRGELELQRKFLINDVSAEDLNNFHRLLEIEHVFGVINSKPSKPEFLEKCEARFDMNMLTERLANQYSVSPIITPFIRDVMADMYAKIESGEILDVNRRLTGKKLDYISMDTLLGISSMMLKEIESRADENGKVKNGGKSELNGGYALYIMAQDFAKLPWPLDYAFNPTANCVASNNEKRSENETFYDDDDILFSYPMGWNESWDSCWDFEGCGFGSDCF